mgnify:CR=1 FL=1
MKKTILFTIGISFMLLSGVMAQTAVYVNTDGQRFTQAQRDSIASLGLPIATKSKLVKGDSVFYQIEVLEKMPKSLFQETFENKPMPATTLQTLDGKSINLPLKGQITMINLWSTTCVPCIKEMPQMNQLAEKYQSQIRFIAIAPVSDDAIKKLLARHDFQFELVSSATFFEQYNIKGYPKNLFIDQDGHVVKTKEGTPMTKIDGQWEVSVVQDYTAILDNLLSK